MDNRYSSSAILSIILHFYLSFNTFNPNNYVLNSVSNNYNDIPYSFKIVFIFKYVFYISDGFIKYSKIYLIKSGCAIPVN